MFESNKPRYMTSAIANELDEEIQKILWSIIEQRRKKNEEMDYLQVFELCKENAKQKIVNRQEQPPYTNSIQLELKESQPIQKTIWVIDSGEYSTMLFPNEY
jgi:hypothetical protein